MMMRMAAFKARRDAVVCKVLLYRVTYIST
jgi:hypothetical protein